MNVFICCSEMDREPARRLYLSLRNSDVRPWLTDLDVLPGQNLQLAIRKAIRSADVILVCLSQHSVTRAGAMHREIKLALEVAAEQPEGAIFIIPVRLEACDLPEQLQQWQSIDLFEHGAYERLFRALHAKRKDAAAPTTLPSVARSAPSVEPASDLELRIGTSEEGYSLSLRYADLRDATDIQYGLFPIALDTAKLRALEIDPAQYGATLSSALFTHPGAAMAFAEARAASLIRGHRLRVRLLLPQALQTVRWETLLDVRSGRPLALESDLLLSRYLSADDYRPLTVTTRTPASSVLVAVAAPVDADRHGLSLIDALGEGRRARQALGSLQLSMIGVDTDTPATWEQLTDGLRQGHDILYLVAHGAFINGRSWLFLTDDRRHTLRRNGSELASQIRSLGERRPRLVVLASCESAGNGYADALAALGPQLALAGVPSVLAMQGKLSMATAERFLAIFVRELLTDGDVDRAVATARLAVADCQDWWMPVLYSRLRTGRLWEDGKPSIRPDS